MLFERLLQHEKEGEAFSEKNEMIQKIYSTGAGVTPAPVL